VLAKELKDLEAHHFIACTVHPGPPVVVDYYVLPYARTLNPVIEVGWYLEQARHKTAKHKRLLFEGPACGYPCLTLSRPSHAYVLPSLLYGEPKETTTLL
jgi:hypothetical protein